MWTQDQHKQEQRCMANQWGTNPQDKRRTNDKSLNQCPRVVIVTLSRGMRMHDPTRRPGEASPHARRAGPSRAILGRSLLFMRSTCLLRDRWPCWPAASHAMSSFGSQATKIYRTGFVCPGDEICVSHQWANYHLLQQETLRFCMSSCWFVCIGL
jgi:hypothetical protein